MEDRKEWQTENSYARQEDLTFSSCDARARARVGTVLALAASAAGQDYDARGLDYPHLRELGQVFLLSRITLPNPSPFSRSMRSAVRLHCQTIAG